MKNHNLTQITKSCLFRMPAEQLSGDLNTVIFSSVPLMSMPRLPLLNAKYPFTPKNHNTTVFCIGFFQEYLILFISVLFLLNLSITI